MISLDDQETLDNQQVLLDEQRRRLAHRLRQLARLGDYAPPDVVLDIEDCQAAIRRFKVTLRAAGAEVADHPDDEIRPVISLGETTRSHADNRGRMIEKVHAFWIKGVLEQSLQSTAQFALAMESRPDLVALPWDMARLSLQHARADLPPSTLMIDVFSKSGGELLILGAPGAGKTTRLLELARALIGLAERDPRQFMPVVFNLSSWAYRQRSLVRWLVDELQVRYDVPRRLAATWIAEDRILPLLDGLDEVPDSRRAACVAAINTFRQHHGLVKLAVCSRTAEYESLDVRVKLQGAVLIKPLALSQIDEHLAVSGERLAALRMALSQDAQLCELAQSPLWLNIMTQVYQGLSADALPVLGPPEARRAHLFETYLERMFERQGALSPYTRAQTIRWLNWLARTLTQQSLTIFALEWMQPSRLPTMRLQRVYAVGEALLAGGAVGVSAGIFYGIVSGVSRTPITGPIGMLLDAGAGIALDPEPLTRWVLLPLAGLLVGLCAGLIGGGITLLGKLLTTGTIRAPSRDAFDRWSLTRTVIRIGIAFGCTVGMVIGMFYGPRAALIVGLSSGPLGGLMVALGVRPGKVSIVERLRWDWSKMMLGASIGGTLGLLFGLTLWAIGEPSTWLTIVPIGSMIAFGVKFGLISGEIDTSTQPNHGIRRSARTALRVGGAIGIMAGLLSALAGGLPRAAVVTTQERVIFGIAFGLVAGLFFGLIYGGAACLQHILLRLLLWRSGVIPWNYAAFLDYCAGYAFLRKVGSGYMFIHRLLQDFFAEHEVLDGASSSNEPEEHLRVLPETMNDKP
jgi:hypothetical protein